MIISDHITIITFLWYQVGLNQTMIDLTVEPKLINLIKRLLRCEGVKYTTAIIDLQVVMIMMTVMMMMMIMIMIIIMIMMMIILKSNHSEGDRP